MSSLLAVLRSESSERLRLRRGKTLLTGLICLSVLCVGLGAPAVAAPTLTLSGGVQNPPPNLQSTALNPQQTAIADTATLIPAATFSPVFQALLTAEGYSNANNWTFNTNTVTLANNATFNLTAYNLFLNPGGNAQGGGVPNGTAAGSYFGENIDFTLNPYPAAPGNLPAGAQVTQHWLQIFNASTATANGHAGVQLAAPNNVGYWYIDNGFVSGGLPTGPGGVAPYYDSNGGSIVPPDFEDSPKFFRGNGYFLHFQVIPVWDVFVPAKPATDQTPAVPASETIYAGNFGVAWGFRVVPEPSSIVIMVFGMVTLVGVAWKRKK
jgi:hypothetical protein